MALLALLNDVESELDEAGLVSGDSDGAATRNGEKQSLVIAKNIHKHMGRVDAMAASPAVRLAKLIHNIRVKSNSSYLAAIKVKYLDSLKERSFGVLNGSKMNIDSDLFNHTRICAEGGESVAQVRRRIMNALEALCNSNKRVLAVSHPFACQVACNTMLGVNQVSLVKFWFRKGALVLFENKDGWKFKKAFNLLEDQELTFQDIYTELVV
jgi:broad specificity phosphatase PhoE